MTEPLLMVSGMMCDGSVFAPQIAEISRHRPIHVAPIGTEDRIDAIADRIIYHAPPRFALLGYSMGGIVAMEIMRRVPRRITRIALVATDALAEPPHVAASREPNIVKANAGAFVEVVQDIIRAENLAPTSNRVDVLAQFQDMARGFGAEAFVAQSRALQRRPDQQKTLLSIAVPTLVLCGRHDSLCPVRRHELMADLVPNAVLEILENSGHLLTLEEPEATSAAILRWLTDTLLLK